MPRVLTPEERLTTLGQMEMVSASSHEMTDEMLQMANELARIHGRIRVCNETSGIHFYLASPACLDDDGTIELEKLHLAVNVTKYVDGETRVAQCMKTGLPYDVNELLSMQPLSARGYEDKPEVIHQAAVNEDYLEDDGRGNMVPKSAGDVTPIFRLPSSHPAREYLASRGYNPIKLYQQFRLGYGEKERTDVHYRKMLNGFRATPQGRLVFHIDIGGVFRGWQARILEKEEDGVRFYLHPYSKKWLPVLKYDAEHPKKWVPVEDRWKHWDAVKYVIGHGCRRNESILGFDAAVAHNRNQGTSVCFFMEGALDAGRIGPPAVAILGKSLSGEQFKLLTGAFEKFVYIPDNDDVGEKSIPKVMDRFDREQMGEQLRVAKLPDGVKDIGDMTEKDALEFAYSNL